MEETELWLRKSERDMLAAEVNFKERLFEESAFFSHQAAEKALKALYIKKFKRLWKVHDLRALAQRLRADNTILKACEELNPCYIETRYPVEVEYTEDIAASAISNAKKVIAWVKKLIKK